MDRETSVWLPESALVDAFTSILRDVTRDWSIKWLVDGGLRLTTDFAKSVALPGVGGLACSSPDMSLVVLKGGFDALIVAMLPEGRDRTTGSVADDRLLRALVSAGLEDFGRMIGMALQVGQSEPWTVDDPTASSWTADLYTATFTIEDHTICLTVPRRLLVAARKARLPGYRSQRELTPIRHALGDTSVKGEVSLGHCTMPLNELVALADGDVLVLSHHHSAALALRLVPGGDLVAACTVEPAEHVWQARITSQANLRN